MSQQGMPQMPQVPVMQQGGIGGAAGLGGILAQIPRLIQAGKMKQQQDQLQSMVEGNQQLDIYRKMIAADPNVAKDPNIIAAISKIGSRSGITLPWQQTPSGGLDAGGSAGAASTGSAPAAPSAPGAQPAQHGGIAGVLQRLMGGGPSTAPTGPPKTGPALDVNAFLGGPAQTDFGGALQKNLADIQATDPKGRQPIMEAILGRPLTSTEATQLGSIKQQFPPAQEEARRAELDKLIQSGFSAAAKSGTASQLFATVRANYPRLVEAYGEDTAQGMMEEYTAPVLDQMSPVELEKIAEGKAKAGLQTAQTSFIQQSAAAKVDLIKKQADEMVAHATELRDQGASLVELAPMKSALMKAQITAALSRSQTNASTNARNMAEAGYYGERVQQIKTSGDPRQATAAMASLDRGKAAALLMVRSYNDAKAKIIAGALNVKSVQPQLDALDKTISQYQTQANQYGDAIQQMQQKLVPGLAAPALTPTGTAPPLGSTAPPAGTTAAVPAGTQPGAMLNGKPIFNYKGAWVYQNGSPAH